MSRPLELHKPMSVLRQRHNRLLREHRDVKHLNRSLLLGPLSESMARMVRTGTPREAVSPEVIHNAIGWLIEDRDYPLGTDLLHTVHHKLGCPTFPPQPRSTNPRQFFPGQPRFDPAMISRALQRFETWIHSQGYREMHPLEQLTASQLRLCEIQPFEEHPFLTAWTFSLSFPLRSNHLLPSYGHLDPGTMTDAVCEGFRLSTFPLLSLHLEACQRSFDIVEQSLSL